MSQVNRKPLGTISTICEYGQDLYGQCRPFSKLSNIPFLFVSAHYYSPQEIVNIFKDPRFMHYSVSITNPGLNGQRLCRASKKYPTSFVLQYWNSYEKYRPGSKVSNNRISAEDLVYSLQYVLRYELRNDEIEIEDEFTHERIFIYVKMNNFQIESTNYVDTIAMFDPGSARYRRAGL